MTISLATTDKKILACLPVMRELRPGLSEHEFVVRVRAQQAAGYRLAFARDGDRIVTVAGYRIAENLAWGRFLYVDDLVTTAGDRSSGHGARMLDWLRAQARVEGCGQMHLDSGLARTDAHRFYAREGMPATGFHFAEVLDPRER